MVRKARPLVLKEDLGFSQAQLGLYMSCMFGWGAFVNGFMLKPMTRLLGGHARFLVGRAACVLGFIHFVMAVVLHPSMRRPASPSGDAKDASVAVGIAASELCLFIGLTMLLALFECGLSTSISAESTQRVPKAMKGTLIGMEHGIFSTARILTPAIGITLFTQCGTSVLYAACGTVFALLSVVWSLSHRAEPASADAPQAIELETALAR